MNDSDANSLLIESRSGDVTGSFRSEKRFVTHTSRGDVNVPRTNSGGICEIGTSSGDICFKILE